MAKEEDGVYDSSDNNAEHPLRTAAVEDLLTVLRKSENGDDLFNFLLDVSTPRELAEIAQRLQVARMLKDGMAYVTIEKKTGASATTIARVSKCLQYGNLGYAVAISKLEQE
ncbi:MAG: YerC/YecD family TrpR-related protein [Coriobacteriia bacterium]|nr:YerC/YecD family TrpR-related protein [Coriobacteriia bacterium]